MSQPERQPYSAASVANFFLDKAEEEKGGLDNLKLQKLVYIGYGWALAVLGRRLFDEPIEAWRHGPVIPSLYHEFKHNRAQPINERAWVVDWERGSIEVKEPRIPSEDKKVHTILRIVWDTHKRFSGWSLSDKAHEPGSPWRKTYTAEQRNNPIDDSEIESYFRKKIKEYLLNVAN